MKQFRPKRQKLRLKGTADLAAPRAVQPTTERRAQARLQGGLVKLPPDPAGISIGSAAGPEAVRYPMLIDYLRDAGHLTAIDHATAAAVRELYERTGFRAHLTGRYAERAGPSASPDPAVEAAEDRYRRLEMRVLRNAGHDAWTALRAVVIEDRMTTSWRTLPAALEEAEKHLTRWAADEP